MDNNTFFNSKNKDLLYNICRDEIVRETNYNIDDNRKYYRTFGEIMKITNSQNVPQIILNGEYIGGYEELTSRLN